MKIGVLFGTLWCLHAASAAVHSYKAFYTASSGIDNFPEFVIVGMVDDVQYLRYDSNSRQAVLTQEWTNSITADDPQYLQGQTQIAQGTEQSFKANINIVKERFNQTAGVHTVQVMYGCQWDDESQATDGFRQHGYDGKDFISLDIVNRRWIAPLRQSEITKQKWDADKATIEYFYNYHTKDCIDWLKKYVDYGSSTLGRKVAPEVSLIPKSSSEVACHATGFYPHSVMITWKKNGVEVDDDVDVGETLPNEDGTFQKRAVLTVSPEERKNAQYSCQVTHKSGEPIVMVFEEANNLPAIIGGCIVGAALIALIAGIVVVVVKKKNDYHEASQSDGSSRNSAELTKA